MAPPPAQSLTLIVATTKTLGIGRAGALPWPSLKGEMGYFARVTKYVPSPSSTSTSNSASTPQKQRNAVIMGRKTWSSIPLRFRPLKDRVNVVVSSTLSISNLQAELHNPADASILHVAPTLDAAVTLLRSRDDVGRLFVIGGAGVYGAAMERGDVGRVLLTKVTKPDFECDTFFPVDLEGEAEGEVEGKMGGEVEGEVDRERGKWRRGTVGELGSWTGEGERLEREGARRCEEGVEYEFCLYERV